jgi:hypothetical protein
VLFDDDGGDQPFDGGVVGKHAHDHGAPLELAMEPLEGFVDQIVRRCQTGKAQKAGPRPPTWCKKTTASTSLLLF